MRRRLLASGPLLVLLVACGGAVETGGPSPTPSPSSTTPTPSPTTPTPSPSPTEPTPSPSPTTPTPSPACGPRTKESAVISLSGSYTLDACRPMTKPSVPPPAFDAAITGATSTTIDLDLCSPAADCVPRPLTIHVVASGLDLSRTRVRSYVHVELALADTPFYCTRALSITSIDAWDGVRNPADVGGRLYLAVADGNLGEKLTLPFTITREATGCAVKSPGCGGFPPDDYALRFGSVRVPMGTYGYLTGGTQVLDVRNLRSFQESYCDAANDWAWWVQADDGLGAL
jgi:hypothetical protein